MGLPYPKDHLDYAEQISAMTWDQDTEDWKKGIRRSSGGWGKGQ